MRKINGTKGKMHFESSDVQLCRFQLGSSLAPEDEQSKAQEGWQKGLEKKEQIGLGTSCKRIAIIFSCLPVSSFKRIPNKTHCLKFSLLKRSFRYHHGADCIIIAQKLVRFNRAKLNVRLRKTLQIICFSQLLIQRIMHAGNFINIYNLLFRIFSVS